MKVEQIYTGCLAQGAYYIHDGKEAAIIDPLREVQPYIDRARKDGVTIKYIFETHFHADFVSGHLTLAEKTGASIVFGPSAQPRFEAHIAQDGEEFRLGDITLIALHTPGHTMESTTYLLRDSAGRDHAIFTGDTLFLGDVGRPDLAQKAAHMTQEQLASTLFHSLRDKIMPLADDVIVYPGHGAGSACGKNMMKETVDTLGNQKRMNYALRADMTEADFVTEVLDGLQPPPGYFPHNVKLNKEGYEHIEEVVGQGTRALDPKAFEEMANRTSAIVLDVRSPAEFAKAHIPRSIFIGIDGSFAPWVGEMMVDVTQPILLVCPEGREEEVVIRLSRVGFDNSLGYLQGGVEAWESAGKEVDSVPCIDPVDLKEKAKAATIALFDVRNTNEYESQHVGGAYNAPLAVLNDYLGEFPEDHDFYVHCAGGYRSMIASSVLKSRGIHNLVNVNGGFKAMSAAGMELTEFVCPTTL